MNEALCPPGYRAISFIFSEQWNRVWLRLATGNVSVVFGALETDYAFSRFLLLSTKPQRHTTNP